MSWINDIFWGFLQQFYIGVILFFIWKLFSIYLQRIGAVQWAFILLKCVLWIYIIPVGLIIYKLEYWADGATENTLFMYTPLIHDLTMFFAIIWLLGSAVSVLIWFKNYRRFKHVLANSSFCCSDIYELVKSISFDLKIKEKIDVYQNRLIDTPFIINLFAPKIYLPCRTFGKDELELILTHELLHYKNRDLFYKYLGGVLLCIQWFNPFAQKIFSEIDQWCEFYCDYSVYKYLGNTKDYFTTMLQFQTNAKNIRLTAMLFEKGLKIKRRIAGMTFIQSKTKNKSFKIILAMFLFIVCGSSSVFAADFGVKYIYDKMVDKTAVEVQENLTRPENTLTEYMENGEINKDITVEDAPMSKGSNSINWTVNNNVLRRSTSFYVSSGGTISIVVSANPSNVNLKMGIITPDDTRRYVIFKDQMIHTFTISDSGNYRIFAENSSGVSVDVEGYYLY